MPEPTVQCEKASQCNFQGCEHDEEHEREGACDAGYCMYYRELVKCELVEEMPG